MCKEGGGSTNRSGEWVYTVQQTAQDSGVQQTVQVLEVYTIQYIKKCEVVMYSNLLEVRVYTETKVP